MTQTETTQAVLSDGEWHPHTDIKKAIGPGYATSVNTLRKGGALESQPTGSGHAHEYRLKQAAAPQEQLGAKVLAAAFVSGVTVEEFTRLAAESHAESILALARAAIKKASN